jgi:hypothetical protein
MVAPGSGSVEGRIFEGMVRVEPGISVTADIAGRVGSIEKDTPDESVAEDVTGDRGSPGIACGRPVAEDTESDMPGAF